MTLLDTQEKKFANAKVEENVRKSKIRPYELVKLLNGIANYGEKLTVRIFLTIRLKNNGMSSNWKICVDEKN